MNTITHNGTVICVAVELLADGSYRAQASFDKRRARACVDVIRAHAVLRAMAHAVSVLDGNAVQRRFSMDYFSAQITGTAWGIAVRPDAINRAVQVFSSPPSAHVRSLTAAVVVMAERWMADRARVSVRDLRSTPLLIGLSLRQ